MPITSTDTPPAKIDPSALDGFVQIVAKQAAEIVLASLAEREAPDAGPALIDQESLARELGVTSRTVFTLRREGLPHTMIGTSPRFELAACLEWLRTRKPKEPPEDFLTGIHNAMTSRGR